jgi:hypothetical protein
MNDLIIAELYRTLLLLGADHQLLGTIGSWADGSSEKDVLTNIQAWNSATAQELKARIEQTQVSYSIRAYNPNEAQKIA